MEEREVRGALLEILRASLNGAENSASVLEKIKPNILPAVFRLAKKQDLGQVVATFLLGGETGIEITEAFRERLEKERLLAIYRCEQMRHALAEISAALEETGLDYIPLKGSVLRAYYPYESMRTSCDIDVLVRKSDLKSAVGALEDRGYTKTGSYFHDVWLYSPSKVHLELHFSICENIEKLDAILDGAWEYAHSVGGHSYAFDDAFFIFYTFAHMSYHLLGSGSGIRSLLDIWVMEHRMNLPYTLAKELLERAGIYKFAEEISALSEKCFGEKNDAVLDDPLLIYVLNGGTYGSSENGAAVQKARDKSRLRYFLKRIFLPYKDMKISYPVLRKLPILLPVLWVVRWAKALFGGKRKGFVSEMKEFGKTSDEKIEEVKTLRSRLGM